MKRSLTGFGLVAVLLGVLVLVSKPAQQAPPPTPATSERAFLLMLGEKASAEENWDGAVRVAGGAVASTTGWHFSATDKVTGAGAWTCKTRRDEILPFADFDYTEMAPGETPKVLYQPVGIYVTVSGPPESSVQVRTAQGNFEFGLASLRQEPTEFLNGRATVLDATAVQKLSTPQYEDDEPAVATLADGSVVASWVAYQNQADRVLLRTLRNGVWTEAEEVTPKPADIFRCSVVAGPGGGLWAFWSQRENDRWQIWGREKRAGKWQPAEPIAQTGSNTFHRAAASASGQIAVVWQSYRNGQSDIFLKVRSSEGSWSQEARLSDSPANDWEPSVAMGADGAVHAAWDTYARGNYDVQFRTWRDGNLSAVQNVTGSPNFQAHASVAVDRENRPWVAWNEGGVNWAKDQGFLIPTPLGTPIHQERWIRVAMWDGKSWLEPKQKPGDGFPPAMRRNSEHPQIVFDGGGTLYMVFRHWTRQSSRTIGSAIVWENYRTLFDGERWSTPDPILMSGGSIEKHAALTRDAQGAISAAWMTDNRPFSTMVPANADIYFGRLTPARVPQPARMAASQFSPLVDPMVEAIPVHNREAEDIKAMRSYAVSSAGKQYKIYRGDMHRHTDVSRDFKYDGSLIELYRYALDVAGMDYIAATDHNTGYDQEFTWWQNQKLVDLFFVPGGFTPLFAYERSIPYPNGHRNVIWSRRGFRTLPVSRDEQSGIEGAAKLYAELKRTNGITMPHSTGTDQGTDFRDHDPDVEPLIEIYQGYRTSYEYEGAPRSATALNKHAQKSGFEPQGFWWNALDKGYKLGVQASSDHWSTHISYACILAESWTREGLLDAIRKRHSYAATDNIVLDFQAVTGRTAHLMGDVVTAQAKEDPQFLVRVAGTGAIKQIDLIKNHAFIYTTRPDTRQARFDYVDKQSAAGESWYYVRVLQEDGQLAWSSPIWIRK
jgi:hypothetical protein